MAKWDIRIATKCLLSCDCSTKLLSIIKSTITSISETMQETLLIAKLKLHSNGPLYSNTIGTLAVEWVSCYIWYSE